MTSDALLGGMGGVVKKLHYVQSRIPKIGFVAITKHRAPATLRPKVLECSKHTATIQRTLYFFARKWKVIMLAVVHTVC